VITGSNQEFGMAFTMDGNFARLPEGMALFAKYLMFISGAVTQHAASMAAEAIIKSESPELIRSLRAKLSPSEKDRIIARNVTRFAAAHKNIFGISREVEQVKSDLIKATGGLTPTCIFFPPDKRTVIMSNPQYVSFDKAGPEGPQRFNASEYITSLHGIPLREFPALPDIRAKYDQLTTLVRIGNYAHLKVFDDQRKNDVYWQVYDAYTDDYEVLTPVIMLENAPFFHRLRDAVPAAAGAGARARNDPSNRNYISSLKFAIMSAFRKVIQRTDALKLYNNGSIVGTGPLGHLAALVDSVPAFETAIQTTEVWDHVALDRLFNVGFVRPIEGTAAGVTAAIIAAYANTHIAGATARAQANGAVAAGAAVVAPFFETPQLAYPIVVPYARPVAAGVLGADAPDASKGSLMTFIKRGGLDANAQNAMAGVIEGIAVSRYAAMAPGVAVDEAEYNNMVHTVGGLIRVVDAVLDDVPELRNLLNSPMSPARGQFFADLGVPEMGVFARIAQLSRSMPEPYLEKNPVFFCSFAELHQDIRGRRTNLELTNIYNTNSPYTSQGGIPKVSLTGLFTAGAFMKEFDFLFIRPLEELYTQTACAVIGGESTGNTILGKPNFAQGKDTSSRKIAFTFSQGIGAFIWQRNHIAHMRNLFYAGMVSGANTQFISRARNDEYVSNRFQSMTMSSPSAYSFFVGKDKVRKCPYLTLKSKEKTPATASPFRGSVDGNDYEHAHWWYNLNQFGHGTGNFVLEDNTRGLVAEYLQHTYVGYTSLNNMPAEKMGRTHHGKFGECPGSAPIRANGDFMLPTVIGVKTQQPSY
jgi:hypothetical protein